MIDRFAAELPADLRRVAYDYIRECLNTQDRKERSRYQWDALFRLDRDRARHDSLDAPPDGLTTEQYGPVELWVKYPGESMEVATLARKWLREHERRPNSTYPFRLLELILRSDPKGGLLPTTRRIEEILSHSPRRFGDHTSELFFLVQAMVEIDLDDALPFLLKYIHEPSVLDYTRLGIFEWLAEREYAGLTSVMARWLREEDRGPQDALRDFVARSRSTYAKSCLEEADRINDPTPVGKPEQGGQPEQGEQTVS